MTDAPQPLVRHAYARGITTLTLDSPHNRNALSARLVAELGDALAAAGRHAGTRAVLLTHTGTTFCAGADLSEPPTRSAALNLVALLRSIVELPKPVVARVTGHVRAGGLGLLGACDIAAAGGGASFAFTEARLGLAPAMISIPLLPRLDPRAAARYYLTGERFDAAEAARIGLVTLGGPVADVDELLAPVLDGLRRGSPQGLAESKRLVTAEVLRAFTRETDRLAERSAALFASAEAREGMTAFLERRDPAWVDLTAGDPAGKEPAAGDPAREAPAGQAPAGQAPAGQAPAGDGEAR
ncbi:enoyl-CoA hydratase family protein [Streptomyces sp. ME19-01-6]|uniref:enoyl-CoA hydratase family protein n=1 Tax=Streptomyces sp. ME19-01-6 TaxID=3028686 RepID=UPI0029A38EB8|nr:enoyl-CoA hydratase family protein [Streptomyces sp. ME19-01-6]MDX3227352.1 enoyl-CoA hydratase family protein [Streptomyces sp. ME19-01-6]